MNFNTYPSRGFLNTYFGFKIVDYNPDKKFKFTFSDGSSTDWITENTLVYKQFLKAGEQKIILETETEKVEKIILIEDSLKLGNGKSLDIRFPENDKIIIQRKTTGIVIFFNHLDNKLSKDILPDEIWNWNESQLLFFTKEKKQTKFAFGKFGFFDFKVGEFAEEFEGTFIFYSNDKRKIIFHESDKIFIRYPDQEPTVIDGEFITIDNTNSFLFLKKDNTIKQFSITENSFTDIGQYEFYELTNADNLVILKRDDAFFIWDTQKKFFVERSITNDYTVYSDGAILKFSKDENTFETNIVKTNTRIAKTRFERFETHLSVDRNYLIRSSSLKYFESFLINELDKDFRIHKYNFKSTLIADLILVEIEEKRRLFSLTKNKIEFQGEGEIVCGFTKDEKTYVVIQNASEVSFFEYANYLKLIQKYEGKFDIQNLDKLIKQNMLWLTISFNHFKVYNGITKSELKEIKKKETHLDWILTEEKKFVNALTLEEKESNFESYYSVNFSLTKGIIQKADGFYLVNIEGNDLKEKKIFDSDLVYTNCDVHPTGKIAILSHQGMTEFLDLETFDKIEVPDTSFLRFDNKGKVILNSGTHYNIKPRIFDPITFQEIPQSGFVYFKYFSPDGTLKSNHKIEVTECEKDHPTERENVNGVLVPKKIKYLEKRLTVMNHPADTENKLLMKSSPDFINFLSFSPKNNFIAYAGKVSWSNGVVELFKVSTTNQSVTLDDSKVFVTGKAIWRCVFSSNNKYLGYYTSDTVTYIVELETVFIPNPIEPRKISYRSIECFSPDSLFIVLSQHRYEAITVGGVGWIPSSKIFITEIENLKELLELDEHNSQVVFANFSSNGKKLISRSDDGIVVIRNFDYDKLVETKTEIETQQQTADISN